MVILNLQASFMGERFLGALLPSILSGLIGQMCFMIPDKYKEGWISSFILLD